MLPEILSIGLLLSGTFAQSSDALNNVTNAFSMSKIVPDVIDSFNPTALITMTFTDSVTKATANVNPGTVLSMEQSADEPMFFLDTSGSNSVASQSFVIVIIDPDAPTPQMPNISQFLHFVAGDFTVDSSTGLLSNSSPALIEFYSPTPPTGSDIHRYVALVFDQPDGFEAIGSKFVNNSTPRTNFSETTFAQQTNLGPPIAGTYFLVGPWGASLTPTAPPVASPTLPSAGISIKMHHAGDKVVAGLAVLCTVMAYLL